MLKKAVQDHQTTNRNSITATNKPLAQQLFPSSSPIDAFRPHPQHAPRVNSRPLASVTGNALKASTLAGHHGLNNLRAGAGQGHGVKRTASGLAKALQGQNLFEESGYLKSNSQENPFVIRDLSPEKKAAQTKGANPVYFDENDFDSDLDLDIEDPASKQTVAYPRLAQTLKNAEAVTYPEVFAPKPNEPTRNVRADSGYGSLLPSQVPHIPPVSGPSPSSAPIPWSSSPIEHRRTPLKAAAIRQFQYILNQEPHTSAPEPTITRPSKRRTLPWLEAAENQVKGEAQLLRDSNYGEPNPGRHQKPNLANSAVAYTPLPKDSTRTSYPWNTTASAIKEQQKNLRKTNKKSVKTNEADEESLKGAKARKKRNSVARVFLSDEQQHVLSLVVQNQNSVFFTGSAGTGKSVLLREIIAALRKKYQKEPDRVAVTASTGLAACNVGGVTLHSFAGIGLGKEPAEELIKKIKRNQKTKHRWMRTKVLIIDEISMVDGELFDKLEEIARRMRNNGRPFGGIQLVITGDFFQLPPVPERDRIAKFAFDAGTWNTSIEHTIGLHHVFRQKDPVFAGMLNEMREGRLTQQSIDSFKKLSRPLEFEDALTATELFPTRSEVDTANNSRMRQLSGDVRVFEARDGGTITDVGIRTKLLQNCMAPEVIELKKGAQVMLIKNIDEALVNGSLGHVIGFMSETTFDSYHADEEQFHMLQSAEDEDLNPAERKEKMNIHILANTSQTWPVVRFTLVDGTSRDLLCNRETWKVELPNGEVQASRAQVPLILAWALSIHKAQGQTLERVKVDLGKVFEKGQAYVALSRATSMEGLQVLRFDPKKVVAHDRVRGFYASLSRAEVSEDKKTAANKGKRRKNGITAESYERDFVEDGFDYDGADDDMLAYG